MSRPRVVVMGSANMDLVVTTGALPKPGETVFGTDFVMVAGGKGANQAIAATRAGADGALLGAIGSDSFGVTLKARISAAGVDTERVRVVYGASGVAVVTVDAEGENTIVVTPAANSAFVGLTESELTAVREADVLVAQLEIPVGTVTEAARAARSAGTRVVLNAAPAQPVPVELLDAVDLLVVNEAEARAITGCGQENPAALLDVVPRAVLTLGRHGAWYGDRDGTAVHVPAVKVDLVDSTAAGDAFTGALAVAWGEGRELVDAVRWASAAGAACARRLGASVALPLRAEIDALYVPAG
ncbi:MULTISPECIES: ribokinase [unclassified Plantactinospora]|uniref:ribokinase n=1 Tax=unclassified Plantactinospora TaxID=2631981 RepID=UPI000D15CE8A|nr:MULTISPECIES: ribokinase [unclassified Plantactinospora]AVT34809.1 ribokinase [Plantactinospora sp. BC1]AVT41429.1 ribokinase [Plantactinospora sp. BB1]